MKYKRYSALLLAILLITAGLFTYHYREELQYKLIKIELKLNHLSNRNKAIVAEDVIQQMEQLLIPGEKDVVVYLSDGTFLDILIQNPETAEVLFSCIRNFTNVWDSTGINLPTTHPDWDLSNKGSAPHACGSFSECNIKYQKTEQWINLYFTKEDAARFEEYVKSLPATKILY